MSPVVRSFTTATKSDELNANSTQETVDSIAPGNEAPNSLDIEKIETDVAFLKRYLKIYEGPHKAPEWEILADTEHRLSTYGPKALPFIRDGLMDYARAATQEMSQISVSLLYDDFLSALATETEMEEVLNRVVYASVNTSEWPSVYNLYASLGAIALDIKKNNPDDPRLTNIRDQLLPILNDPKGNAETRKWAAAVISYVGTDAPDDLISQFESTNVSKQEIEQYKEILNNSQHVYFERHRFKSSAEENNEVMEKKKRIEKQRIEEEDRLAQNATTEEPDVVVWWRRDETKKEPSIDELRIALTSREYSSDALSYIFSNLAEYEQDTPDRFKECVRLVGDNISLINTLLFPLENQEKGIKKTIGDFGLESLLTSVIENGLASQSDEALKVVEAIIRDEDPDRFYLKRAILFDLALLMVTNEDPKGRDVNVRAYTRARKFISDNFDLFSSKLILQPANEGEAEKADNINPVILSCLSGTCNQVQYVSPENKEKFGRLLQENPDMFVRVLLKASRLFNTEKEVHLDNIFDFIATVDIIDEAWINQVALQYEKEEAESDSESKKGPYIFLRSGVKRFDEIAMSFVNETLLGYGYTKEQIINLLDRWEQGSGKKRDSVGYRFLPLIAEKNIDTMRNLERFRPGICKKLYDEFGIAHFSRYPESILIAQYDQKDFDVPYILISNPEADSNRSFYTDTDTFESLYSNLRGYNSNNKTTYVLRIVEGNETRANFSQRLYSLRNRYKNSISGIIFGGHSDGTQVILGDYQENPRSLMGKQDVENPLTIGVTRFFTDNAFIIFNACSTGAEGNIAQATSKSLDCLTIGPNTPSTIKSVRIAKIKGSPVPIPIYVDEEGKVVESTIYYKGKKIDLKDIEDQ